jgi:hypothetical protein
MGHAQGLAYPGCVGQCGVVLRGFPDMLFTHVCRAGACRLATGTVCVASRGPVTFGARHAWAFVQAVQSPDLPPRFDSRRMSLRIMPLSIAFAMS